MGRDGVGWHYCALSNWGSTTCLLFIISHLDRVMHLVKENLTESQQQVYNCLAQACEFYPGDEILVLIPNAACKFLAFWQGPYTWSERVGLVNYQARQPERRRGEQIYHINLLKRWVEPANQVAALVVKEWAVVDLGTQCSAAQKKELEALVSSYSDVFSETPGRTDILCHEIRTPPGTIIRQWPYRVPEAR